MTFETLGEILTDHLPARRDEMELTISESEWADLIERLSVYIPYPTLEDMGKFSTIRGAAKADTKKGKKTNCYFCVWITRVDSGRYEYGCNT